MINTVKIASVFIVLLFSQSIFSQSENLNKETFSKIDSLFKSYNQQNKPGAAFSIIKNEKTLYQKNIGLANIEYKQQITDSTVFNIASISKQFTTFLALILEEENKLSFSDDIRKHLPELQEIPVKITIKQLTNHTHGLPNPDELAQLKGKEAMTHQEVLAMLLNIKQTNFLPGDKFEYNNTGYILLSEIIERIGQKPFKQQLQEKIFTPLGMMHTQVVDNNNTVIENKAYSYSLRGDNYVNFPVRLSTIGSSGINTTINDLSLWVINYYNLKVGSSEFLKKMEATTILNSGEKINYGLGFYFETYKGIDIVFHGGGTESYRSYMLHAPKHNLSLVYLSNAGDFSGLDVIYNSLEIILKDSIKEETLKNTTLSNKKLQKFEGTYEMFPGNYLNIISEKNNLYVQEFGSTEKSKLTTITENEFGVTFIPHSKFIFHEEKFDFHIADFIYPCIKTDILLPKSKDINLNNFVGIYKNNEHNIIYELNIRDNNLIATSASINYGIILNPLTKNSFYSKEPFFGKIDFINNPDNNITAFKLSGQNLNNITFKKL